MSANRTLLARLNDIRDAIERIGRYTAGKDLTTYGRDEFLRDAVERCVEIISEASRQIPTELKQKHPKIPWQDIAGIGNILRHEYSRIEDRVIWNVVTRHLEPLSRAIAALLRDR